MQTSDSLQRMYEELANRYARQGEARQRDHFLVLAADAALNAGQLEQAERLRKRLLLTNPHHLLRPFASMAEAMQSTDVRDYVADLRRQWPPEKVETLVRQTPMEEESSLREDRAEPKMETIPLSEPPVKMQIDKPRKAIPNSRSTELRLDEEDTPRPLIDSVGYWAVLAMFLIGLMLAGGMLFAAFGRPIMTEIAR